MAKNTVSKETIDDALKIAKGTARPGQTKEQTKLIAQGIEKGIAEYKKREKAKARERDKARKKNRVAVETVEPVVEPEQPTRPLLPWVLLAGSWLLFITIEIARRL